MVGERLKSWSPEYGAVQIIAITDKQYENIKVFKGKQRESPEKRDQLLLF